LMTMALRWEYGRRALQWAATHDGLTGLHNRSSFLASLQAVGGARRRATDATAVLYLDLDDFKPVNDEHGHTLGDRVLVEVAARLRGCVRPSDTVARLGGDEFAVLCPGLADISAAELLAERLVAEVSKPIQVDSARVQIGLSVGISVLQDGDDVERVLNRADTALRAAKLDGKSRWQVA
jgi:diguanylate cyclase (GGDEF)-like protein